MTTANATHSTTSEVERLRGSMNDLLSILALPAMWAGSTPTPMVRTLAEALYGMLDLELVYISIESEEAGAPVEVFLGSRALGVADDTPDVALRLRHLLGARRKEWPVVTRARIGAAELTISVTHLGSSRDVGVIVVGSARPEFPSVTDRMLVNVSANQITVALQEARLRDEQKRIADKLDERVAQRTRELLAANQALEREVAERRKVEVALQQSATSARAVIDGIPGMTVILGADGGIETASRQNLDYLGNTLEELKHWGSNGIVHPDDMPALLSVFVPSILAGQPFQTEQRLRRHDGVYRWFDGRLVPVRDESGRVVRWYVLLTDAEERKRGEMLLAGEKHLLEMIASGRALRDVLSALCAVVEDAAPDCYCDIHTIDWTGPIIKESIAPSLPESYTGPIAGTPLRAEVVPCGIAAHENVQVIAEDFDTDPRWCTAPVRKHVVEHGLRAVWSTPVRSKSGKVLATLCMYQNRAGVPQAHHQDIIARASHIASIAIERLRAEEELRRSQTSLADAQHISLTGSFSWFVDGDVYTFSEQLSRIFELDEGETFTFETLASRVHPDDLPMVAVRRAAVREGRDNPDYEMRLRMPDGRIKHVRVIGRTVRHSDGRLECIGAVQDVTAQRQAEEALNKVRSDLAHATRVMSLGTLAASITHEVNQPLSGIITNASTCLRMLAADTPNIDGALETARRTIRDANRASDVLARLRPLFRKTDPAPETVDVHQAVREVIALSHLELQRQGITVLTEFADTGAFVAGDRVQLQQVILNLLLNAADSLKATEGRERRMAVSTVVHDGAITIAVSDNGVGLDPEQSSKLFDAFFTTKDHGMGIGLSVSRSIIERHRGRLWAESNDDGGATFSCSLPLTPSMVA